jgi:ATP-dependent RNA helicase DDX49/DBP8
MALEAFKSLGLSSWLAKQCVHLGYKQPTDVQKACVKPTLDGEFANETGKIDHVHSLLQGRDIYAAAKTGSGKTGAFALPILQTLSEDPFGVYAVVLAPTRCVMALRDVPCKLRL